MNRKQLFLIGIIAFVVLNGFICFMPYLLTRKSTFFDFGQNTGTIGDTIGGTMGPFIAIIASILTFLAFWVQYTANEQQRTDIKEERLDKQKEGIEDRFFELIKLHRDNVNEITFTYYEPKKNSSGALEIKEFTAANRKVFKLILDQFEQLHSEVSFLITGKLETDIYLPNYREDLYKNKTFTSRPFSLVNYAVVDILYLIIFFGLDKKGRRTIENFLIDRYNADFYEPILHWASLKPVKESDFWDNWIWFNQMKIHNGFVKRTEIDKSEFISETQIWSDHWDDEYQKKYYLNTGYYKYYGGHQFRLGHYFRHLFQTITYINEQKLLTYNDKYSYIRVLRGQLSTHEQIIYFLNSVSILGRITELELRNSPHKAIDLNQRLITKYKLIRNIPNDIIIDSIKVSSFYPDIDYEAIPDDKVLERRMRFDSTYT